MYVTAKENQKLSDVSDIRGKSQIKSCSTNYYKVKYCSDNR